MVVCSGTRRDGAPCTAIVTPDRRFCYHHDPARAEERRRNASRAASAKHSKIGGEIRGVRLMVGDLVETTVSNELDVRVKKRLAEIAQLLQTYCRLAELELAAGGRPQFSAPGEYGLPEDMAEKAKEWAEKEAEKEKLMEGIGAFNKDPVGALEAMK